MKKAAAAVLLLLAAGLVAPPADGKSKDRLRFNLVVVDARRGGEDIRLTLPLRLVEAVVRDGDSTILVRRSGCRIDLRKLLRELERSGRRETVRIREGGKVFKVWVD